MSANVYWIPVAKIRQDLSVSAPSAFMDAMSEAGFRLPTSLNESALPVLAGMAAASKPNDKPFRQLITAIENHGTIQVNVEY